ncbi:ribosomal protein S2, flavodoxin-like domain-containing protein [Thelonectria olida]|uniref:Ribosomal protein S2, flavodoxin-like domain-containing protein n=1 Tax=Thelonectria olida TaxID=1576542 RepID=A0A9P9AMX5_9HYPO|nr:ribosomal protein S2, flavodoxin-like domain-containing protein [Thelonectria olida]
MIVRNAAVRHGRRTLPSPISKALLRQLSTETTAQTPAQTQDSSWSVNQPAAGPPKIVSASRKKQRVVQDTILSLATDSAHEHKGKAWTTSHQTAAAKAATPAQQYASFRRIQDATRSLGSQVERRYVPTELISNPPRPEDVTLELLMASQTHLGHSTSLWNPANSRYIYGVRDGIHVISLETTAAHLRRAARVVEEVAYGGGLILFVGTRKGQMEIVTRAAELAGACHLFTKWTPGGITNRDVILAMHGTKVVDHQDKELDGFDKYRGSARPLLPDLVVCLNPLENYTLLYECGLKSIPTIGVIDTNADPSWVTYTIPANDDSLRSMGVVAGVLGRAGEAGQKRRLADAARNKISWNNPEDIERHMRKETKLVIEERKAVMGRVQQNVTGFSEDEQKLLREKYDGQEVEVTEAEMVSMLGETAVESSTESTTGHNLASIEEQLLQAEVKALDLEVELNSSQSSVLAEAEAASTEVESAEAEVTGIELTEAKSTEAESIEVKSAEAESSEAQSTGVESIEAELTEAESAASSKLESIESQLAGLKTEALAIEAELKPNSGKSE